MLLNWVQLKWIMWVNTEDFYFDNFCCFFGQKNWDFFELIFHSENSTKFASFLKILPKFWYHKIEKKKKGKKKLA
jgi:hypothetical protein